MDPEPLPICLALQGGGAHGAYAAGVLRALLADGRFRVAAASGASAGALNAAALVQGLAEGGPAAALALLDRLWAEVGRRSPLAGADGLPPVLGALAHPLFQAWLRGASLLARFVSPYQPGLPSANALGAILRDVLDFDRLRAASVPLFVSATSVRTGDRRVFAGREVTCEALLASACLPDLFQAVEVGGEPYWDGGYSGNPCLAPLVEQADGPADVVIVQVTPFVREGVPRDVGAIMNRVSEITFNAALMAEIKVITRVRDLVAAASGPIADPLAGRLAAVRLHLVPAPAALAGLGPASKLDTRPSHLAALAGLGRAAGEAWLASPAARLVGRADGLDPALAAAT